MRTKKVNLRSDDSLQGSERNYCPILSFGSREFTGVPENRSQVMTGELDDMFNSLLNNSVPNLWNKDGIGYPCLKPLNSWFEDRIAVAV